jgi:glycosyltransferase involved in cell wall biosynthesis
MAPLAEPDTAQESGAPARRALFLQCTDPAYYPPLIHASRLMAEAGWHVTFLSMPVRGRELTLPPHKLIREQTLPPRTAPVVKPSHFAQYLVKTALAARRLRPALVYASDPTSAGPALLAASISGASLVYHEHDSPAAGGLRPWVARLRRCAAQRATLVIFPNAARADLCREALGISSSKLRIIWNLPERCELPARPAFDRPGEGLGLYFHGSLTPDRLPEAVITALNRFGGRVRLTIAGYEAPSAKGYLAHLLQRGSGAVTAAGEVPQRAALLEIAAGHDAGLAFMPTVSTDINMAHMTGASNKAFDYMAAGMTTIVSDLPEWRALIVEPGYGLACDPASEASIAAVISELLENPERRCAIGVRARRRIEDDWNYDTAFAPVLTELSGS